MDLFTLIDIYRGDIGDITREIAEAARTGDVRARKALCRELEAEVERYLEAMEAVIHPALSKDERTQGHVAELEHEHAEIRRFMADLHDVKVQDTQAWTRRYRALVFALNHYFTLQQHGAFTVARRTLVPHADALRRAFEREQVAGAIAQRWHVPKAMVPERYGLSSGTVFATIAGVVGIGLAAVALRRRGETSDRTAWELKERSQANRAMREEQRAYLH